MADNKIYITTGNANNQIGISGDNSQYFSNEARKSAEKSAQSALEAKDYATQTQEIKNSLLANSDFIAVKNTLDEIVVVSENLENIEATANNIEAVKTTSGNIANINTTVSNLSTIQTVSSNVNTMNTVVNNLTPIKNTANNISSITNVNTNIEAVKTNSTNIADIKTNATNISDIKNTAKLVTTLDEKVDIDDMVQVDFADAGSYISEMAMPSNKWVALSLGASDSKYTAPANGYFTIAGESNASNANIALINGVLKSRCNAATVTGTDCYCFIPAKKGDEVTVQYASFVINQDYMGFWFVYAEGEVAE